MRIAFLLNEFPALSQPFVLNQITGMIDRGHDVDIYAIGRYQVEKSHPQINDYGLLDKARYFFDMPSGYLARFVMVIGLVVKRGLWCRPGLILKTMLSAENTREFLNLSLLYQVLAFADRDRYDIIHCQFGTQGPLALKLRKIGVTDGKIVTSFRGFDITKVVVGKPGYYKELFQLGALFLPVSKSLRDKLLAVGCPPDRIRVLHSGIDCSRFRFAERSKNREDAVRVLSIGRFVEKKGWSYAIDAVANVLSAGRNIKYTIIGDGGLRDKVKQKIADRHIGSSVALSGWCEHDEITRLLDESHILLAPSVTADDGDQEGIPNVLKEAMAMGLPVLSTFHSGIPELVEDGVTGYLVPERDVDALTERLISLCDHPEQWAKMGRQARKKIDAEFDTDKINIELDELYAKVKAGEI
ncbi:MAG: colanic acid biosynthesis glycosyltransferase WcaL [Gammaproteobacteria bacterium]|nr:MAG: colanic acid biosynthesis glycosyltransferase WcaL [Gammaproteobacteria bacterium]